MQVALTAIVVFLIIVVVAYQLPKLTKRIKNKTNTGSAELEYILPTSNDADQPVPHSLGHTTWRSWQHNHDDLGQYTRIKRALSGNITLLQVVNEYSATFQGSEGEIYVTTASSCSCMDFMRRNLPCKHMYYLANHLKWMPLESYLAQKEAAYQANRKANYPTPKSLGWESSYTPHPLRGYMNAGGYAVVGINPSTGRKNTKHVTATDESRAIENVKQKYGLVEPFEVTEEALPPPTEGQLEALKAEGILPPPGATKDDVSAILTRYYQDHQEAASPGLVDFYKSCDFSCSYLSAMESLVGWLVKTLPEREKAAFYVYAVYCSLTHSPIGNLKKHPHAQTFYRLADEILSDTKLKQSFLKRRYTDYLKPHKGTAIFSFLSARFSNLLHI